MKKLFAILAIVISGMPFCYTQEISKADIIKTLQHIQALSQDQECQLKSTESELFSKQSLINWQANQITNLTIWGNKCEQAVKALAEIAALCFSLYLGSVFGGIILRNFPSIEGPFAVAICYAGIFLASYYGLMTCIYAVSAHIPTVPVWHDVHAWASQIHAPKI